MAPFHCVYDSGTDVYQVTQVGVVTAQETLALFAVLREDPNKQRARAVLIDATRASTNISLWEIPDLAKESPLGPSTQKTAVVLRRGFLAGLHALFVNYVVHRDNIHLFYSVSDALVWLSQI